MLDLINNMENINVTSEDVIINEDGQITETTIEAFSNNVRIITERTYSVEDYQKRVEDISRQSISLAEKLSEKEDILSIAQEKVKKVRPVIDPELVEPTIPPEDTGPVL